jgi:hypothetical protein
MRALHNSTFQDSSNFIIKNNIPYFYYPNDKSYCGKLKHNLALDTLFEIDQKYDILLDNVKNKNQYKEQEQEPFDFIYKKKNNIDYLLKFEIECNYQKQHKKKRQFTKKFLKKKKRQGPDREKKRQHNRQNGYMYKMYCRGECEKKCELTFKEHEEELRKRELEKEDMAYYKQIERDEYYYQKRFDEWLISRML